MDYGWIRLHRKITENPLYFSEPFTRIGAWIDLILIANHKEGFIYVRGNRVVISRGQVGMSQDHLAQRWKWSRGKVIRFLDELEKDNQIVRQKNHVTSLLSIVKYNEYQSSDTAEDTADDTADNTADERQTDGRRYTNKNEKNVINDKNIRKHFVPPTLDEIMNFFLKEKGLIMTEAESRASSFMLFYESKGWVVGKCKMSNWKSAATRSLMWGTAKPHPYVHPSTTQLINYDQAQINKF